MTYDVELAKDGPPVTGQLTITDPDGPNQEAFQPVTEAVSDFGYGTYSINADGSWSFTVDTNNPDIQTLAWNNAFYDFFEATSVDGTTAFVTVRIDGAAQDIDGTSGDDELMGTSAPEIITGGAGNDTLSGGGADDTYVFNLGDGSDTIQDQGRTSSDRILFGSGITSSDVTFSEAGADLIISIDGTSDDITIENGLSAAMTGSGDASDRIEFFDFADNTRITLPDVLQTLLNGTNGNDVITGYATNDTFTSSSGDDSLTGGAGSDTFDFHPNFGNDSIEDFDTDSVSHDVIQFDTLIFADFAAVLAASQQVGSDVVITADNSNSLTLKSLNLSNLHADDFQFA